MVNEVLTESCGSENLEVRQHWEDLSLDGIIISKLALNVRNNDIDLIDLAQDKKQ
jgi:hypothetical protein